MSMTNKQNKTKLVKLNSSLHDTYATATGLNDPSYGDPVETDFYTDLFISYRRTSLSFDNFDGDIVESDNPELGSYISLDALLKHRLNRACSRTITNRYSKLVHQLQFINSPGYQIKLLCDDLDYQPSGIDFQKDPDVLALRRLLRVLPEGMIQREYHRFSENTYNKAINIETHTDKVINDIKSQPVYKPLWLIILIEQALYAAELLKQDLNSESNYTLIDMPYNELRPMECDKLITNETIELINAYQQSIKQRYNVQDNQFKDEPLRGVLYHSGHGLLLD